MKQKLYISKSSDRETVRQGKEKDGSRTVYFTEYWAGDAND